MRRDISVLVTDLDNTLFDWFDIWHTSFSAMLDEIVRISGLPVEVLEREIKAVHEKHGTSEYAFLIEELPSLVAKHPSQNVMEVYEPAIEAYRQARRSRLVLYPSVRETLEHIKASGRRSRHSVTKFSATCSNWRSSRPFCDGLIPA